MKRHPDGLATLFLTEAWERFSYYGMRALLVLFLTAPLANGGLELDLKRATTIYGLYTSSVYVTAPLGGFLADRFLGAHVAACDPTQRRMEAIDDLGEHPLVAAPKRLDDRGIPHPDVLDHGRILHPFGFRGAIEGREAGLKES